MPAFAGTLPTPTMRSKRGCDMIGTIESNGEAFNNQLNEILNLNLAFLKNNRKGVLDSLLHW